MITMPIPSKRVYRGAGRPVMVVKRDRTLVSRNTITKPPRQKVITTYGNTERGRARDSEILEAYLLRAFNLKDYI